MIRFKKCKEGRLWNFGSYWGTSLFNAIKYWKEQEKK